MENLTQIKPITKQEVHNIQHEWGNGVVKIGKIFTNGGDYKEATINHINTFYAYDKGIVLFKPTVAHKIPFRLTFDGALSYFIGENPNFPEDKGFALTPWKKVRWENAGTIINGTTAVAMGHYFFTSKKTNHELKVEYSFGYQKDNNGSLRIILQGSHLPFSPPCN